MDRITHDDLKKILEYNEITGDFIWIVNMKHNPNKGKKGGSINRTTGYRYISIYKRRYYESHLAWFYMTGSWPEKEIDHINRIKYDNSWKNLRLADRSQNNCNKTSTRKKYFDLPRGVSWSIKYKKYQSQCKHKNHNYHLGYFDNIDEAKSAYDIFARETQKEFMFVNEY